MRDNTEHPVRRKARRSSRILFHTRTFAVKFRHRRRSGWSSVTLAKAGARYRIDLTEEAIRMTTPRGGQRRERHCPADGCAGDVISGRDVRLRSRVSASAPAGHGRALRQINRVLKPEERCSRTCTTNRRGHTGSIYFLRGILCGKLLSTRGNTTVVATRTARRKANMLTRSIRRARRLGS